MAAPGQNQAILYNESDSQTDPQSPINTGSKVGSVDKANKEHEEHVVTKVKDGDLKGITSKLSKLPKYNLDSDRIERAMNPQYRKKHEQDEHPNMKRGSKNKMDASGQIVSNTENQSSHSNNDVDYQQSWDNQYHQNVPGQEHNTQFKSASIGDLSSRIEEKSDSVNDMKISNDESKFKKVLDDTVDSNNVPLASAGDIVTNIGNKLHALTRHGKIMELEDGTN
jgi:hypothetical protein